MDTDPKKTTGSEIMPTTTPATPAQPIVKPAEKIAPKSKIVIDDETKQRVLRQVRTMESDIAFLQGTPLPTSTGPLPEAAPATGKPQSDTTAGPAVTVSREQMTVYKESNLTPEQVTELIRNTPAPAVPTAPQFPAQQGPTAPPPPPATRPQPTPQPQPAPQRSAAPLVSPLHTYRNDVNESVQTNRTSVIDMAVAEQERNAREAGQNQMSTAYGQPTTPIGRKTVVTLLVLILLGGGGVGGWYGWQYLQNREPSIPTLPTFPTTPTQPATSTTPSTPSLPSQPTRPVEISDHINITGMNRAELITRLQSAFSTMAESTSTRQTISFTQTISGATVNASPLNTLSTLEVEVPRGFLRSLTSLHMGVAGTTLGNTPIPYLIAKTDSFETTFSGMLKWEPTITQDIGSILFIDEMLINQIQDKTITLSGPVFKDVLVSNLDVRVLKDIRQNTVLAYSLIDAETLIITRDEGSLLSVVDMLRNASQTLH